MKLNACHKHKNSNLSLLLALEDQGWTIDIWGNAKRTTEEGKLWRWKFQHHTIRIETQIILNNRKSWLRKDTIKY